MLVYRHGPSPPPRRHRDRRAGAATDQLREAFDGPREAADVRLTPAQIERQRARRRAWKAGAPDPEEVPPGKVDDVLTALAVLAAAFGLVWMVIAVFA